MIELRHADFVAGSRLPIDDARSGGQPRQGLSDQGEAVGQVIAGTAVKALRAGAERIGGGDLSQQIRINTGDELEALADQFNDMAGRLQESYAGLEQKVEQRTREVEEKSRQLEMASQHKSQFLASMSHELRTPLNAIIGLTEMMVSNAARFGTEKAAEPLRRVQRTGTHLLGLINQVLDLSKIKAGKLELSPVLVALAPLISEVVDTARPLAEQNNNRLVVKSQENLGSLTVDPMRLRQNPAQSVERCLQIHQAGRSDAACAKGDQPRQLDRVRGVRYRDRHNAGAAGEDIRGIHSGGFLNCTAVRWDRSWPGHHAQARTHDGRRCDTDE